MAIPPNWADPTASPTIYARDANWAELRARYEALGPSRPLEAVFEVVESNGVTHALQEHDYIDADYRDEFANFYASTFPPFPDRCERLHFLDTKRRRYLGYSVIRPVPRRPVCRTVLLPPDKLDEHVSCTAISQAVPYGLRQRARGFPFIGQDHQYGVCAHASIWMTALYHHLAHRRDRYHLSDLVRAAGAHQEADRLIPSSGLTTPQMAAVFRAIRLPAMYYDMRRIPLGEDRVRIVSRYLDSRLPVVVAQAHAGHPGHATALVGYRRDGDGVTFIENDDAEGPYREATFVPDNEDPQAPGGWRGVLVGLPGKIYLPGESAEEHGRIFFQGQLAARSALSPLDKAWKAGELRIRSYVVQAADYKARLVKRGLPDDLVSRLRRIGLSHWLWIVELQEPSAARSRQSVLGEAVIDATSDRLRPRTLAAYVPGAYMEWRPLEDAATEYATKAGVDDRFVTGCALNG